MNKAQAEIDLFMRKCDEVTASGFILADTKIGELLKSVVTSDLLYALFRRVLRGFDYAAACQACMGGQGANKRLLFPEDPAQKLAFIFCLLVDLDSKRIDLSALLQEYFYEDGSLYESYYAFCNQVVKPMRGIVRAMLQGGAPLPAPQEPLPRSLVQAERDDVVRSSLPDGRKVDALLLLNEISARAEGAPPQALAAALCGYLYFCAGCGRKNERTETMRAALESIKEEL